MIWTDHKNLSYLRLAICLTSRQVHWALFLGHFSFTLTYCPGSQNIKPDTLSHQSDPEASSANFETILLSICEVAATTWEIPSIIQG